MRHKKNRMKILKLKKNIANINEQVERFRHYRDFDRSAPFAERAFVRAVGILLFVLVVAFSIVFFMTSFNKAMHEDDSRITITANSISERYSFSNSMLASQGAAIREDLVMLTDLQKMYMESNTKSSWHECMNMLLSEDSNLEFYYYEGDRLLLKSSNAQGWDLGQEELDGIIDSGKTFYDVEAQNVYAAVSLGNGVLTSMYRNIGNPGADDMRKLYGSTQLAGIGGIVVYDTESGNIYNVGSGWTEKNINDLEYKPIFDNMEAADEVNYTFTRLIGSLDKYRTAYAYLDDTICVAVYYSVRDCLYNELTDVLLPVVFLLLGGAVIIFSTVGARIVHTQLRAENRIMRVRGRLGIDTGLIKRASSIFFVCMVIVAAASSYVTALTYLSRENTEASENLDSIIADKGINLYDGGYYTDIRDSFLKENLDAAAALIEKNDSMLTNDRLADIAAILGDCDAISIYDSEGMALVSSDGFTGYMMGDMEEGGTGERIMQLFQSDERSVLVQKAEDSDTYYYAVKCSYISGIIRFTVTNSRFKSIISRLKGNIILREADFANSDVIYYDKADPEHLQAVYSGTNEIVKVENSLNESELRDNYFGLCKINGINCYINVAEDTNEPGNFFISAGSVSLLVNSIARVAVYFAVCLLAVLVMLVILLAPFKLNDENVVSLENPDDYEIKSMAAAADTAAVSSNMSDGPASETGQAADAELKLRAQAAADELKAQAAAEARRKQRYNAGHELLEREFSSAVSALSRGCVILFIVFMIFGLITHNDTGSLVSYLYNSDGVRGVNIFSLTLVFIILLSIWTASRILQSVVAGISENTGAAGITVGKLMISMIKFASLILAIMLTLSELGVQTGQILAGAGLTSVVIGIGAQDTVSDILAGLFIIFEGHLHVGDMVKINGWVGRVKEIGVRTTCIESWESLDEYYSIRILNNSDLKDVINLSSVPSIAVVRFDIAYETDVREVERVFEANKAMIREELPAITAGPSLDGIISYNDYSKTIRFRAKCDEMDRQALERDMLQCLGRIFEKEGMVSATPSIMETRNSKS